MTDATDASTARPSSQPAAAIARGTAGPRRSVPARSSHAPRKASTNDSLRRYGSAVADSIIVPSGVSTASASSP
ncbi:MAG: hypothetical protein DMG03_06615 [Acidobacteria bacterium]|nr:MAG: hypothetical protein DMG03_06615 [Acidobacteriota bacterium]